MQVLIPSSQIISLSPIPQSGSNQSPVTIYKGEWIYIPLSDSALLVDDILNVRSSTGRDISIMGYSINDELDVTSKQIIRSQIAVVKGHQNFPEKITVGEEIANNLRIKGIDASNSNCSTILDTYNITSDRFCNDLSTHDKLILAITIAVESDISMLILDGVISQIAQSERELILNYIHRRTVSDGLTVIIRTDNTEVMEIYMGRDISNVESI